MLLFLRSSLIRPPTLLTVSFDRDWREGGREEGCVYAVESKGELNKFGTVSSGNIIC